MSIFAFTFTIAFTQYDVGGVLTQFYLPQFSLCFYSATAPLELYC